MTARTLALAVDLGNTRVKARTFDLPETRQVVRVHGTPSAQAAFDWDEGGAPAALAAWWSARSNGSASPCFGALTSVVGAERTNAVCAALAGAGLAELYVSPADGLVNATHTPETVGHDRLYAARGALERCREEGDTPPGLFVVDAGTALTVDALELGSDEAPRFLGGAIAPGPALLADALARGGAQLPEVEPRPGASALGRDTPAALQAGIVVGFRGAAARLLAELRQAVAFGAGPVFVTGGARALLLEPDPFVEDGPLSVDPWLVERGLLAAALDARGTGPRGEADR